MTMKLDTVAATVLVVCAIVTTALLIRREFLAASAPSARTNQRPVLIADWRDHLEKGNRIGPSGAPVQLIEFADFECPFCASFHENWKALRERYPAHVSLSYVHLPLQGHRFAEPAARAAECAGEQGHFEAMHDRLFEEQDKLGLKPWSELAAEAGVTDLAAFDTCIKSILPVPRIEAGKHLSTELDVQSTPTLIINGWKLVKPPTLEELDAMVKAVLAGKAPVSQA